MQPTPIWIIPVFVLAACFVAACASVQPDFSAQAPAPPAASPPVVIEQSTQTAAASPTASLATSTPLPSQAWWSQGVFYEIFVRSFFDSNGDGIGDINGIIEKIDYLNDGDPETTTDLGVIGLWLMPVFAASSYHGYGVTDYLSINPDYGTLDDFKRLIEEAHQRGMKVILDLPLNHTSNQHPWFKQAIEPDGPFRDYYIWSESDPGYRGPWNQEPWHPGPNGGYYYGIYSADLPDLNLTNSAVAAEMDHAAKFWLELGVDGFRLDGARYLIEEGQIQEDTESTHQFWKDFRASIKADHPEALLLGEVWTDAFKASSYTKNGDELDMVFDFDLANSMVSSAANTRAGIASTSMRFNQMLFPNGTGAPFLTNHDVDRAISQLSGDFEKAKNAAWMMLTAPGAPFIYYGEEIGMPGMRGADKDDIQRRLPMQWTAGENAGFTTGVPWAPIDPSFEAVNVAAQVSDRRVRDPRSLLSFYRDLIELRSRHPALLHGETYIIQSSHPAVYAVLRSGQGEGVLVLVNLSDDSLANVTLRLRAGPLKINYALEPLVGEGQFAELSANSKGGFDPYQPLPELPPYGRYILQLQPLE